MKILSVNTASPKTLRVGEKSVTTGIFKTPRQAPVYVGDVGLEGDTIVNKKVHGGVDRAIVRFPLNTPTR